MAHLVSCYVVCEDGGKAQEVADKLHNVVIGYGLDGHECGMTIQTHDEDAEFVVFNPDVDDDD